jgi:hypothetical protein
MIRCTRFTRESAMKGPIFVLFMISNPIALPNRPATGRFHVSLVAIAAFTWQYASCRPNKASRAPHRLAPQVP